MKAEHKVIALSIACGLVLWVTGAVVDYLSFHEASFLGLLGPEVPLHRLYYRSVGLVFVVGSGVVMSGAIRRRRRAKEDLKASEEKYRLLVENADAVIAHVDTEGKFVFLNRAGLKGLGAKVQDVVGKSIHEVMPETAGFHTHRFAKIMKEGQGAEFEDWFDLPTGRRCYSSNIQPVRDNDGNSVGVQVFSTDITQRKRAQEALQDSEERYRAVFEQAAESVVLVDGDTGALVEFNDRAHENLGYTRDEFRNLRIADFEVVESPEEVAKHTATIINEGADTFETKHRTKDGEIRDILVNSRGISIAGKDFAYSLWRDITEGKRAEEALRGERDRLKHVFEAMDDGVYVVNQDYDIEYVNPALIADFGPYEGRKCYAYFHDRQEVCPWCKNQDVFAGKTVRWEWYSSKNGRTYDLVDTPLRNVDGSISKLEIFRDITERKRAEKALRESEEKYRHLFEQLNDAAFLADAETGILLDTNAQAEALLGRTRDEIIGMHQSGLHPPDKSGEYRQMFASHVATGRAADYDGEVITKDGSVVPVTISAGTLTLGGRRLILGLFHDITERRQLEEQLHQAQKMEAVGTLASGVAHDFNNLLTAIFGYTELAKKTLDEQNPAVESLEMVKQAAHQASAVVKGLLTFGRKVTAHKKPVDLGRVVSESMRLLRRVLPASIEITEQVTDDPNTWVKADETQLQQVLMNLAVNARDAMPDGGQLRILLQPAAAEGAKPSPDQAAGQGDGRGGVMLVVEDTGTGMSPETRQRVFEPFFTTKGGGQGTGLGMSVIHGIVTDHGGEIQLDSTPGAGTRVAIRLPRCDPDQAPAAASSTEAREPGRGESILVVDDDAHVRSIVTSVLRSQGYDVVQANDGEEAMAVLNARQKAPRLVLLDLDLPRRSGLSCLDEIRRTKRQIPVILITGQMDFDPGDRFRGSELVLNKPFQMSDLVGLVGRMLAPSAEKEATRC